MPRPTRKQIAQAEGRRLALYELALQRLPDWPTGMPPLVDTHIGILVGLHRMGLVEQLPPDNLGQPRFLPTPEGLAPGAFETVRKTLAR